MDNYPQRNYNVYGLDEKEIYTDTLYTGPTSGYRHHSDVFTRAGDSNPYHARNGNAQSTAWSSPKKKKQISNNSLDKDLKRSSIDNLTDEGLEKASTPLERIGARFAESTSMIGVLYIHQAKSWYARLAWVFFLMAGIGAMTYHLYHLSDTYFSWPKHTTVVLGFESLKFPAITICNVNPVKASHLHLGSLEFQKLLNTITAENMAKKIKDERLAAENPPGQGQGQGQGQGDPLAITTTVSSNLGGTDVITESTRMITTSGGTSTGQPKRNKRFAQLDYNYTNPFDVAPPKKKGEFDAWKASGQKLPQAQMIEDFISIFSSMKRSTRIKMGHRIKDMLIKCAFAGRECYPENFTVSTTTTYGNCFTLEYNQFISRRSGPQEGLEMWINLEKSEFLKGWTNADGLHLSVHPVNSLPIVEQNGIAISAATETYLALQLLNIERLGIPYGDCDDGTSFEQMYSSAYSRQICQSFCEQSLIIKNCNCLDSRQDEVNVQMNIKDKYPPCKTSTEIECMLSIKQDFEFNVRTCTCLNPCTETKYTKTVSSRQWPSEEYGKVLVQEMCARMKNTTHCKRFQGYTHQQLSRNFLKLNIYFEDLNYENITEVVDYELSQFLSDIGGTIGLWIGLSVLSLCELGQLLLEISLYLCKCRRTQTLHKTYSKTDSKSAHRPTRPIENGTLGNDRPHTFGADTTW